MIRSKQKIFSYYFTLFSVHSASHFCQFIVFLHAYRRYRTVDSILKLIFLLLFTHHFASSSWNKIIESKTRTGGSEIAQLKEREKIYTPIWTPHRQPNVNFNHHQFNKRNILANGKKLNVYFFHFYWIFFVVFNGEEKYVRSTSTINLRV